MLSLSVPFSPAYLCLYLALSFHSRRCSSFPLPPADPASVPLVDVLFPSAVFIGQRRHGARLHYTHIHSTVALLEKSGIEPSRPRTNRSPLALFLSLRRYFHDIPVRPCSAGIFLSFPPLAPFVLILLLVHLVRHPSSRSLAIPRSAFFSTFFEPFCHEAVRALLLLRRREKGPGSETDSLDQRQLWSRFLAFVPRQRVHRMERKSSWTLDGHARAEISTPAWEMGFIAATECALHAGGRPFLSFFSSFSLSTDEIASLSFPFLSLSWTFDGWSSSRSVFVRDVTDRNRRGTRHDGKGLAASRARNRSIRIG